MAKLSSDKKSVTVEKGDTLWNIAKTYLGSGTKYQRLADLNDIPNPNLIYPGQVIRLYEKASPSTTSSSSTKPTITAFGLRSDSDNEVFATWTWGKESQTDSYKILWEYYTKDGVWFTGTNTSNSVDAHYYASSRQSTYTIPENATFVRFRVKPISKTKKDSNGKETTYFTASWTDWKKYDVNSIPPSAPTSAPNVEIEKYKLTASYENLDWDALNATHMKFEVIKNDTTSVKTATVIIDTWYSRVSFSCNIDAGNEYKVRCKAVRGSLESAWSDFSSNIQAMPSKPSSIKQCKAAGENADGYSVYLEWASVYSAETYDIEYTTNKAYFDNLGDTTTVSTTDDSTSITIYKLSGAEYFFRVRATNTKGSSDWSEIKSVKIGEPPAAPTTWSSTTTAIVGEPVTLYWMHNSEDGSDETYAELKVYDADTQEVVISETIKRPTDIDNDENSFYSLNTSNYKEGTKFMWQVRTAGVTNVLGDWSMARQIDVYAPPTLDLMVTDSYEILEDGSVQLLFPDNGTMDTLESFPFYVKAVAGPTTQTPIGYHLSIISNEIYETVDQIGNDKIVSQGERVYSKYFDINTPLMVEFSASNVDLENGISYTVVCTVSMDSGLTAEASSTFSVSWIDAAYSPNAEISIDEDTFSASIRPYCENRTSTYYKVNVASGVYSKTSEVLDETTIENVYTATGEKVYLGLTSYGVKFYYGIVYVNSSGIPIDPIYYVVVKGTNSYSITSSQLDASTINKIYTETGDEVLLGVTSDGTEVHYCIAEEGTLVEGVTLSVYRREFDGGFTEIASGIDNVSNTFVTDPHPALDYARYRIVATTKSTGAVSYYDLPGHIVGGKAIVIQWDEDWSSFNSWSEDPQAEPAWSGSLLKLPYNIDVSNSNTPDVAQVSYIGRKHPVTYYGTQVGETATWTTVIEKSDEETLYALRRLSLWMGDVYVREPSGSGYWANIKVSFSQKHLDLTIPVTLDITRVEGGI